MTKWVVAPLVAAVLLVGSAWLNALERTTDASARLAEASRSAPATTQKAAEGVKTLPAIAQLTRRQAVAFRALADALAASATRVKQLNESIGDQVDTIDELDAAIAGFEDYVDCTRQRLRTLATISGRVPPGLEAIAATMDRLSAIQDRSIRHLRSINRKLALLGVAATATGVKIPPAPTGGTTPRPGPAPKPVDC